MADLPPFPVDDGTLDLLDAAIDPWSHGHADAERSSVGDFLTLMSRLGGSDTDAVADQVADNIVMMRDPQYTERDVIVALIVEVRRLREATDG